MFKIIQICFANKPSHQCKTDFSVSFYWEDFLKNILRLSLSLVAREPPIMTLDRPTGQLERDTKSPRGKFFLSICISVILLHHCIERKGFKGCSTGVNFQIITSKGLFRYFEAEECARYCYKKICVDLSFFCEAACFDAKWSLTPALKGESITRSNRIEKLHK